MKTLKTFLENINMYDLEYRIKNGTVERRLVKSRSEALGILKTLKDVDYAYLFKPRSTNTSESDSLEFWYSLEDSNNFWNNTYNSNGLRDSVQKELERKRIKEI